MVKGFRVYIMQVSGCGVQGLRVVQGHLVWGVGVRMQGLGSRVQGWRGLQGSGSGLRLHLGLMCFREGGRLGERMGQSKRITLGVRFGLGGVRGVVDDRLEVDVAGCVDAVHVAE